MKSSLIILFLGLLGLMFLFGYDRGVKTVQGKAVRAGVAKWSFTDEFGRRELTWVEVKGE